MYFLFFFFYSYIRIIRATSLKITSHYILVYLKIHNIYLIYVTLFASYNFKQKWIHNTWLLFNCFSFSIFKIILSSYFISQTGSNSVIFNKLRN